MIKTTAMLLEELKEYAYPKSKLSRMVERGECFPITRGLYETDPNVPAHLLAGSIYGPSYISFEYALGYYGLIPEAVYTVTCATFEKKKKKKYETSFGTFTYRDVPSEAFPLGIRLIQEGDYFYRIAEPEKALCDQLYTISPVPNIKKLMRLLTEDLRIEEAELKKLDANKVCEYSEAYRTTNIKKLCSLLRRM
jgi:predicted transcriptional regulator of viral defense system